MVLEQNQRIGAPTQSKLFKLSFFRRAQDRPQMYKFLNFYFKIPVDNPLKNSVNKLCTQLWTKVIHISCTVVHTFHPQVILFKN